MTEGRQEPLTKENTRIWEPGTVDEKFNPYVTIDGVGRVGTPSRMRSRAHRYWQVAYYDGTRTASGYEHKIATELGTFKTGTLAAEAAEKFAQEKGWTLGDYPKSFIARLRAKQETMSDWIKPEGR